MGLLATPKERSQEIKPMAQKTFIHRSGVYLICNNANGKVYVGSSTRSVHRRLVGHKKALLMGKHGNKH